MARTINLVPVALSEVVNLVIAPTSGGQWTCTVMYQVKDDSGGAFKTSRYEFLLTDPSMTLIQMAQAALAGINTVEGLV